MIVKNLSEIERKRDGLSPISLHYWTQALVEVSHEFDFVFLSVCHSVCLQCKILKFAHQFFIIFFYMRLDIHKGIKVTLK